ncbi:DUF2478 domain-containing protein [Sulfitobacter sp. JB4-11]|uniref:DUF2478 domain-containing protein n=1 Tax=Sulfitobacter rhodophyticola TaxID=3238304 RepID=UPI0035164871
MKIAYVNSSKRGETDLVLSTIADHLLASGAVLAGIVKESSHESRFENGCDMKVRVLPTGPIIKITQDLGEGSDACRLDPAAITEAVTCVEQLPIDQADLFILNKFGPEEAGGRGFVSAISKAVERDIPVLVGVGNGSLGAFKDFSGGLAEQLPADTDAILKWCGQSILQPSR